MTDPTNLAALVNGMVLLSTGSTTREESAPIYSRDSCRAIRVASRLAVSVVSTPRWTPGMTTALLLVCRLQEDERTALRLGTLEVGAREDAQEDSSEPPGKRDGVDILPADL